jgi:hypothetical protein
MKTPTDMQTQPTPDDSPAIDDRMAELEEVVRRLEARINAAESRLANAMGWVWPETNE